MCGAERGRAAVWSGARFDHEGHGGDGVRRGAVCSCFMGVTPLRVGALFNSSRGSGGMKMVSGRDIRNGETEFYPLSGCAGDGIFHSLSRPPFPRYAETGRTGLSSAMATARVPDEGHRARSYDEYPTGDHTVPAGLRRAGRGETAAHPGPPAVDAVREEGGR